MPASMPRRRRRMPRWSRTPGGAQVQFTGRRAEVLQPGEKKWAALPAGAGSLPKGAKLRLGTGTTAKLVANGTTLDIAGGSRITIADDLRVRHGARHRDRERPGGGEGKVAVPGGTVELVGTPTSPAEARIDINARGEAKVSMLHGGGKLDGGAGATLEMHRGESASLAKAGAIHPSSRRFPTSTT